MWYRIDFDRLVAQLLPPVLRSKLLRAMLRAMVVPLRYIYGRFDTLKNTVDSRLETTGNVLYIEKALNDAFYLKERQIFLSTPAEEKTPSFYFSSELQRPIFMYLLTEGKGFILTNKGESRVKVNFVVWVPTFLCTSVEIREEDKYGWRYLAVIKNIIHIYKPAGRTFSIELYDYE